MHRIGTYLERAGALLPGPFAGLIACVRSQGFRPDIGGFCRSRCGFYCAVRLRRRDLPCASLGGRWPLETRSTETRVLRIDFAQQHGARAPRSIGQEKLFEYKRTCDAAFERGCRCFIAVRLPWVCFLSSFGRVWTVMLSTNLFRNPRMKCGSPLPHLYTKVAKRSLCS
ncbi:hypothetical protein DFH11DRAFT_1624843 [Phellopilus nigrolimitatus]|nr:hypothetical protein DFH11DRAFT_1624843 [Phellopilus nigrolimitatus]